MAKDFLWKKISSDVKNTSGIIYTGSCFYFGFATVTGGAAYNVKMYDNTAASGTVIEDYTTLAGKAMDGHEHNNPVVCRTGIYLALGGGTAIVYYLPFKYGS